MIKKLQKLKAQLVYKIDRFVINVAFWSERKTKYIVLSIPILILLLGIYNNQWLTEQLTSSGESFKSLGSFALSLGSAFIGVTAVVFALIVFSMQVNVERLPYELFHGFSSDKKLITFFGIIFFISTVIASLSLIPDSYSTCSAWIFIFIVEGVFAIFYLLHATFQRALRLVNPYEQLKLIEEDVVKNLNWWQKRFEYAKPFLENPNENNNADWQKIAFFQINPHYFNKASTALKHINSIAQRNIKLGDYEVSLAAFNHLIRLNAIYIHAKGNTFFSNHAFLENPLSKDYFIDYTLENLRIHFDSVLISNDEKALNQVLSCYEQLAKAYLTIPYTSEHGEKTHAILASHYLINDSEKLVRLKNMDLLMNGIRSMEQVVIHSIELECINDTTMLIKSIGKLGAFGAIDSAHMPVAQTAMDAFGAIVKRLLLSKQRISFATHEVVQQVEFVTKLVLAQPNNYGHNYAIGAYYGYDESSLINYLTRLTNELINLKTIEGNKQYILRNILVFAEEARQSHKDLLLLSLQYQSSSFSNFVTWTTTFAKILMTLSRSDYRQKDFHHEASGFIYILSWIPEDEQQIRYASISNIADELFKCGQICIDNEVDLLLPDIIKLLIQWSFKIAKHDRQDIYQASLSLIAASYLTHICKCTSIEEQIKKEAQRSALSAESVIDICNSLDNTLSNHRSHYGQIESILSAPEREEIVVIIKKIKYALKEEGK